MDIQERVELKACMQQALRNPDKFYKLTMKKEHSFRNNFYMMRKELLEAGFDAHRLCLKQSQPCVYIIYSEAQFKETKSNG